MHLGYVASEISARQLASRSFSSSGAGQHRSQVGGNWMAASTTTCPCLLPKMLSARLARRVDCGGQLMPDEPIWPIEEHTKAKHELLRRYLGAWFPILASRG